MSHRTRLTAALCAAVACAAALPAAAHAGIVVPPAQDCPEETLETPFLRWNDHARYVRVSDGGLEQGGAGWTLTRAEVVEENHPWPLVPEDSRSLALRGSATTPPVCVGLAHPTIRFHARNTGSPLGLLVVQVVVKTSLGLKLALPIGVVANPSRSWSPSPPMLMLANLLTLAPGERTHVWFRFTAVGLGSSWLIDDVYVDPYSRR
jgi:hypothetical protein